MFCGGHTLPNSSVSLHRRESGLHPCVDHCDHQSQRQDLPIRRRYLVRLSRAQRIGVLKTFTDRLGQVILLSTDQEVVDDKLDAIRHRLAGCYELRIVHDRGVAVTTVHELDHGSVGP